MINASPNASEGGWKLVYNVETENDSKQFFSMTGIEPFMAYAVLDGGNMPVEFTNPKHTSGHDLESIFWILIWICINFGGPNNQARDVNTNSRNPANFRAPGNKVGILFSKQKIEGMVSDIDKYFADMGDLILQFRDVLFPIREIQRRWAGSPASHDDVLTLLQEFLEKVEEPAPS
ncbi:hypothetical protein EW026_g3990 [Hermanssonia centrifuga]|uniref:Fungal-type protein kinase domain-containing protein n=1 Tax=Hermanssonia centrifuga TaxID=98765 RepID=A0A4S4KII8_9APHY|nr:hypothetical protein EW026_g3990 [Hermanssonia centrifuga]